MITSQVLPAEVLQVISDLVVQEALNVRVGRQLVTIEKVSPGTQVYKYRKFTGFSEVAEIPEGAEFPLEGIKFEEATIEIKKIGKAFKVTREENLANKIMSIANLAKDAARVVALEEDKRILDTLTNGAGDSVPASASWSSDTADPYEDVNSAVAKLEENYLYRPDVIVLHPSKIAELRKLAVANAKVTYTELIESLGLKIVGTPQIDSTKALVLDTKNAGLLVLAEDISVEGPTYEQKSQSYLINVFERFGVGVVRPSAICVITGI
ncbi:phage major capsid protein [Archaeoglobus profundus]|uniref:phage major capsid protein n=1 Tax=Archaeoglobus profundus TaxID=84156 RepID=UPI00064F4171|nr:phage major capsid protein [Archaeoglobus profundus]